MAYSSRSALRGAAQTIRNEHADKANTAIRIGDEFSSLVDSIGFVGDVRNICSAAYGAVAGGSAATNRAAIQAALDAGGHILFPGDPSTIYDFDAQLTVTQSNTKLWFPGGAKLRPSTAIPVLLAVGNIETGINLAQSNTLASNALAGAQSITLSAGKGANITAGSWVMVKSDAVVPEHDAAVVNKRAEFINAFSVAGDVVTLDGPLRFDYLTADNAQVYVINWVEGFGAYGLSFDGNNQIACSIGLQMSWVLEPELVKVTANKLQQRFVRFQGALGHDVSGIRQTDALSLGFNGVVTNLFGYSVAEQGLCQDGIIENLQIDRCRHGYTTGAGWTNNLGTTSGVISGIGVPMNTIVGPGVHHNARGAGFDTHEVGMDITFRDLKTVGSKQLGFQVRSVRTRFVGDCFARDCVGAALQIGTDAQDTIVQSLDWQNTNLGTDTASSTDWTKQSPIVDNSARSYLGQAKPNELDNGNFDFWDRGTSFTATGGTANRWQLTLGGGASVTVSRQSHASAAGPESGRYYARFNRTVAGAAASTFQQFCEAIRETAGQRVVLSFDARASVDGTDLQLFLRQYFGTGGAPSANVDTVTVTRKLSTSWARYNAVIDLGSVLSKTFGSNEDPALITFFSLPTAAGVVFVDFDRIKLEVSRTPTDFVPLPYAVEAERVRRWYEKSYLDTVTPGTATSVGAISVIAPVAASTYGRTWVPFVTRKGRLPAVTLYSTTGAAANVRNTTTAADIAGAVTDSSGPQLNGWYGGTNAAGVNVGDLIKMQYEAAVADFA